MHILGLISMVLFSFAFVPQIIAILSTKNVSGISLWLWIMVVSGYITGLVYMLHIKDPIAIVTYLVGLFLASITTSLVIYYRRKKRE